MNSTHDLGGHHGFGPVEVEVDEPVFHERWEGRVFGMSLTVAGRGGPNLDAARNRGERLDPVSYFLNGYWGRWLAAFEMMLEEEGLVNPGEIDAYVAGDRSTISPPDSAPKPREGSPLSGFSFIREVDNKPLFKKGQAVLTRNHQPACHTRLPAYARCKRGKVVRVHQAMVFPDTNAHGQGENPQYVYTVEFDGTELWGESAEERTTLYLDLFESYLEPA